MKLFLTVVLASVLMMKTAEGVAKDLAATCTPNTDTCPAGAECVGTANSETCVCKTDYTEPTTPDGTCKKDAGQTCAENSECVDGTCGSDRKKCGKAKDATCGANTECASGNCKLTESGSTSTETCADAGGAGVMVMASVLLMVATLVTSRIL